MTDANDHQTDAQTAPLKLWVLLDRSGSMRGLRQAVIDGTNLFLDEQRDGAGECRLTLALFDSSEPFKLVVDDAPIAETPALDHRVYQPRGGTPLYDALGALITRAERRILRRREAGWPAEEQMVVVYTDGLENASTDFTRQEIFEMISERQEADWTFVFLGANQDAYATGRGLGIPRGNISNWESSAEGARLAQRSTSRAISERRAMSAADRATTRDEFFGGVREAEGQPESRGRRRGKRSERTDR